MEDDAGPDKHSCVECGEPLQPTDNFCPACGAQVEDNDGLPPEVTPGRRETDTQTEHGAEPTGWDHDADQRGWNDTDEWDDTDEGSEGTQLPRRREPAGPGAPGAMADRESALRTIGVGLFLSVIGIVIPFAVVILLGVVLGLLVPVPWVYLAVVLTILQFVLFAVVGLGYLRYREFEWPDIREYLGVEWPSLRDYGLILVTWIVMLIAAVVVASIVVQIVPEILGTEQTEPAENPVGEIIEENPEIVIGAVLFMFLVVGPAEEILFRGVVQNRLREGLPKIPAIVLASALFAAVHVVALAGQDPVGIAQTLVILFVPSLGFGFIYEYTENIVVPSLLHGFHNSVIVVVTAIGAVYDLEEAFLIPEFMLGVLA